MRQDNNYKARPCAKADINTGTTRISFIKTISSHQYNWILFINNYTELINNSYSMKRETRLIYINSSLIPFHAVTSETCYGLPKL